MILTNVICIEWHFKQLFTVIITGELTNSPCIYTKNALSFCFTFMILHLLRMHRNVNWKVCNYTICVFWGHCLTATGHVTGQLMTCCVSEFSSMLLVWARGQCWWPSCCSRRLWVWLLYASTSACHWKSTVTTEINVYRLKELASTTPSKETEANNWLSWISMTNDWFSCDLYQICIIYTNNSKRLLPSTILMLVTHTHKWNCIADDNS